MATKDYPTKEELHQLFEYRDGDLYWKIKPSKNLAIGRKAGCKQKIGYKILAINKKFYYVHRLIYLMHYGYVPKIIDHIDRNPSNNKIENLREATQSDNCCNKPVQKNSKSGIKGVVWLEKRKEWIAVCQYKGITKRKYFKSLDLAKEGIIKLRQEMHQNFAHH